MWKIKDVMKMTSIMLLVNIIIALVFLWAGASPILIFLTNLVADIFIERTW